MKASCTQKLWEQVGTCGIPVSMRVPLFPQVKKLWEQVGTNRIRKFCGLSCWQPNAHEIAHSAAALHYGCEVAVEISYDPATRYFDGACHYRHPDGELPPPAVRAIALAGIAGEAAYWLGWDNPRLTPDRLTESIRAGRVTVSPGDLLRATGWQVEDMARAFGIVRNAWAWIVAEVEQRARQDHGGLFVPTVPTRGRACGNTESLVPQGMPHVPTVPTEKHGEVK